MTVLPAFLGVIAAGIGAPPVNTVLPVASVSGTVYTGQTLSTTNGTWTVMGGAPAYTYAWRRDGSPIGGATASTYVVTDSDVNSDLTCRVTATDGYGATAADSNALEGWIKEAVALNAGARTFARTGTAWHPDTLAAVATGDPRQATFVLAGRSVTADYIEPAATNRCSDSADQSASGEDWGGDAGAIAIADQATAPNGVLEADQWPCQGRRFTNEYTANGARTFSFYFKGAASDMQIVYATIKNNASGTNKAVSDYYSFSTAVWNHLAIYGVTDGGTAGSRCEPFCITNIWPPGDMYAWGFNVQSNDNPSSAIPTTTAGGVTRNAETLSLDSLSLGSVGSLAFVVRHSDTFQPNAELTILSDSTDADIFSVSINAINGHVDNGKITVKRGNAATTHTLTDTVFRRFRSGYRRSYVLTWDATTVKLYAEGVLVDSVATSVAFTTITQVNVVNTYSFVSLMHWDRVVVAAEAEDMEGYAAASGVAWEMLATWGDSLTEGAGGQTNWPSMLCKLQYPCRLWMGGVGGETSIQIKARFDARPDLWWRPTVIWSGRNNAASGTQVKADIAAMVASLGHTNYVVCSIPNARNGTEDSGSATYITIMALNADLEAIYGPDNWLDARQVLIDGAISPGDDPDVAADRPPASRMYDHIHPNLSGNGLLRDAIRAFGQSKGWIL